MIPDRWWIQSDTRGRVCVREVHSCEWILGANVARAGCIGKAVPITSGEIPPEVIFCPFCGGEIIGSERATFGEPVSDQQPQNENQK